MTADSIKYIKYTPGQTLLLVFILLLAIFSKCFISYHFFKLDDDLLYQASAAKNLAEGHGITIKQASSEDLSKSIYTPLGKWPPGYSLLLAPVYLLTKDLETSVLLLQFASIVLFFLVYLSALRQLHVNFTFTCLFLLLQGVLFSQDIISSAPTDLLAATLCLWACIKAVQINIEQDRNIVLFCIANSATATLRYMYWPVCFVAPLYLLWNGIQTKNNTLRRKGWTSLAISAATCATLYIYEQLYIGSALYLNPTKVGIFLSNLLTLYPFAIAALVNMDFYAQQLERVFGVGYTTWQWVFSSIHYLVFIFLCLTFFKKLYRSKAVTIDKRESFTMLSGLICCTIIVLLAFLSVRISKYYPPPNPVVWTYLSDGRYYLFMLTVLPVIFYIYIIDTKRAFKLKSILRVAFILVILLEIAHGLYFIIKYADDPKPATSSHRLRELAAPHIKNIIEANKKRGIATVVTSNSPLFALQANDYGGSALLNSNLLNQGKLKTRAPVQLVLLTTEKNLSYYKPFVYRPSTKLKKRIDDLHFFSTTIHPQNAPGL